MPCDLNAYELARNEHRRRSRQSFFTLALLHSHLGCIHMVKVHAACCAVEVHTKRPHVSRVGNTCIGILPDRCQQTFHASGRHRKEAEAEKRKAVLKVFIGMFTASIKRWQARHSASPACQ